MVLTKRTFQPSRKPQKSGLPTSQSALPKPPEEARRQAPRGLRQHLMRQSSGPQGARRQRQSARNSFFLDSASFFPFPCFAAFCREGALPGRLFVLRPQNDQRIRRHGDNMASSAQAGDLCTLIRRRAAKLSLQRVARKAVEPQVAAVRDSCINSRHRLDPAKRPFGHRVVAGREPTALFGLSVVRTAVDAGDDDCLRRLLLAGLKLMQIRRRARRPLLEAVTDP